MLAASRDLKALQRELGAVPGSGAAVEAAAAPAGFKRSNLVRWDFGDLPESVVVAQRPRDLTLYPCLVDVAGRVDLRLEPPGSAAIALHRGGVRRLLLKALPQQVALIRERTLADKALVLNYHGVGDSAALVDDLLCASAEQAFELDPPARTAGEFAARLDRGRARLVPEADALRELLGEILPLQRALRRELDAAEASGAHTAVREELAAQLAELVGPRMLTDTPREWRAAVAALFACGRAALAKTWGTRRAQARGGGQRRSRTPRALARCAARRRAVAARHRRLPLAARGAARVAVRAAARHRALGVEQAPRRRVAQGPRQRVSRT